MRIISINSEEIIFLKKKIKNKYIKLTNEELVVTTYPDRFEKLTELVNSVSITDNKEFSSSGLFVKLFDPKISKDPTISFNRGFLDACYRFISDGHLDREQYLKESKPAFTSPIVNQVSKPRPGWPFNGQKLHFSIRKDVVALFSVLLISSIVWYLTTNWRYIVNEFSGSVGPKHVWWHAEYDNSVYVFNRPRKYRTPEEVTDYFYGRSIREGEEAGDCNALLIDFQKNEFRTACYNSVELLDNHEAKYGKPLGVYKGP